jgi:hypothetical protein
MELLPHLQNLDLSCYDREYAPEPQRRRLPGRPRRGDRTGLRPRHPSGTMTVDDAAARFEADALLG